MDIDSLLDDAAILLEIGDRLSRARLDQGQTQAQLAEQAGVSKRTIERVEAGQSTQLATLIRILRVLDLLEVLDQALPKTGPRPLDLLKMKGKQRQRASSKTKSGPSDKPWTWGDDE